MGKRNRVTTRDIAEELGISQSTVSMILSNKANVSFTEETVQKVKTKAKELGYRIKVETRGSGGAKNVLTKAEIAEAECIIVAADTQVPMDRFAGKPVIQCKVADGISKAEELLTTAANGHASIYEAGGKAADDEEEGKDSLGHQIYKHLMNGVSHMLPFVFGGGILIKSYEDQFLAIGLNSEPAHWVLFEPMQEIALEGEGGQSFIDVDFIVYVPEGIDLSLVRAEIERYKIADRTYKIVTKK